MFPNLARVSDGTFWQSSAGKLLADLDGREDHLASAADFTSVAFQKIGIRIEGLQGGTGSGWRQRIGKEVRTAALQQEIDQVPGAGDEPPVAAAESLASSTSSFNVSSSILKSW